MTVPAHDADPTAPETTALETTALETLRRAVADLPRVDEAPDERFDAAEDAARFEAVHDALVAVLADVDRT
jgi:hypothetical protein